MIEWALRSRLWVILAALAVAITGIVSLSRLPVDAVPDITNVSVMVNTKTGALAPEEIEKTVTFPIESELAGLPDVEDIRSLSKYGLSQVIIVFKDKTDIYFARQQVSERLQSISGMLPEGISPELGPVSTGLGEVYMYSVAAKKGSALASRPETERLLYLRTVQDIRIKPALKAVSGVAEVESNGGYKKQIHINVDPVRMEAYGINCHELVKSVENLGENYGGGYIQSKGKQIIVRTYGRIDAIGQIGNIPVRLNVFGQPVRLRQIASIKEGHQQRLGAATHNGEEAVLGTVLMRIGANSREVSLRVHEEIGKLTLPTDVEVRTLYTRSFLVNATIRTVAKNLAEGGILVIAVLFLLLGNIRAALIVALAIPLSMLFAVSGMLAAGISASLMSLGAIDFGLIVDGSVVMVENMLRRLEHDGRPFTSLTSSDRARLIGESAREVGKPVVLGLLIIMAVYLPVLTLSGIEGKMFKPMAETVLYALGASLFIAVFLMPVLALYFLRHRHGEKESRLFKLINKSYRPVLEYSLDHKWAVILPTLVIALLSIVFFTRLGSDFIPRLDEGDMVIGLVRDTSISIDKSIEEQLKSDRVIARFNEVETVFSRMGTPESATDPMGVNFADTFVILKKNRSEWTVPADGKIFTKIDLFEEIGQAIDREVPGQEISLTQPIEMRFNEILEGSRADITLRIFGPSLDTLFTLVNRAQPLVEGIPGAASVEMDPLTALRKSPVLDVRLDYDRISLYGINISDVNSAFEIAMNGREVGYLFEEEMRYPIVVRLSDQFRRNTGDIGRIPVAFPEGGSIPISRLSYINSRDQITTIARSRARRYAAISINLKNRDTQSFVDEAREKIEAGLKIPAGYSLDWGGQFKNLETARNRLLVIIPVVLAVIFFILLRTFRSIRQALLVFNSIPFAVTGGIILLFVRGIPMSVSAGVGFIALTGIAILNGMVLVSFFNQLRESGHTVRQAVREGTLTRLRPVLMTALVASLGFIPMAYNTGMGAEVQRPLATVVIGGLVSATILTLLLLPTLYLWLESGHETTAGIGPPASHPDPRISRKSLRSETSSR